jgi:molybdopterin synthase catalytic subunit
VTEPIDPAALARRVRTDASGAVVTFAGVVRDHHRGKRVERLSYEAYAPMAQREMERIAAEVKARWDVEGMAIVHRVGTLKVGETSIVIAVAAAHRKEALQACDWALDRVKETVPIWKKEHGEAGEGWVMESEPSRGGPSGT